MSSKNQVIQRIELSEDGDSIHCPFCGSLAINPEENRETLPNLCRHALFFAHDEGFEYRSERFDSLMGIQGFEADDIDVGDSGFDGYTDSVPLKNSVKFAIYQGAPSFFGVYIGFAPTENV